jgi:hypothetical protein
MVRQESGPFLQRPGDAQPGQAFITASLAAAAVVRLV